MEIDRDDVVKVLNEIVEVELAGAVRYTQYSLMVYGHGRIPIMSWMREQADEALAHAALVGEEVTSLGAKVSLGIGALVGAHHETVDEIMQEMLLHERAGLELYYRLLDLVQDRNVSLEEVARQMIRSEEVHIADIQKMARKRGDA